MNSRGEITALTGLRGIGAVWVFLFHLFGNYELPIIHQGNLAVPMFFVLSGFILSFVHETDFCKIPNARTLKLFFSARLARIYPLHIFVLLVLLLFTTLLPSFIERYQSQRFSLPNFFATLFLIQTWGIGHFTPFKDASDAWNGPAWSLSAEMAYYLLFPWIANAFIRIGKRDFAWEQVFFCAALMLAIYFTFAQSAETFTRSLICGWFAFCFGISISIIAHRSTTFPTWIAEIMGSLLIITKLIFQNTNTGVFVLGVGALIYGLTRSDSCLARTFSRPFVYFFGKISFSIYIIHWPIIQLSNYLFSSTEFIGTSMQDISRTVLIPIVFILAHLTYIKFELPARAVVKHLILKQ